MKCNEARELFSPWMDNEISSEEREALQLHLEACTECRKELREWEQISQALKNYVPESMEAPPELINAVMAKIREDKKPHRVAGFKKAGIGIAAALALFLGSSSMLMNPVLQVAEKNPPAVEDKVVQTVENETPNAHITGDENEGTDNSSNTAVAPENTANPGKTSGNVDNTAPPVTADNNNKPTETKNPVAQSAPVFLNKDRAVVSTLIKMDVADAVQAQQSAMNYAIAAGANVQSLGQQVEGEREYLVLKFVLSAEKAAALKNNLSSLGSEISRQESRQDLKSHFNEALEEYRVLSTQATTTQDKAQAQKLEEQIRNLENQLNDWDNQSSQETVVLWLEN